MKFKIGQQVFIKQASCTCFWCYKNIANKIGIIFEDKSNMYLVNVKDYYTWVSALNLSEIN